MDIEASIEEYEKKHLSRGQAVDATKDGVLRIPDGKEVLDSDFAYFVVRSDLPRVERLIIPAGVKLIESMRGDDSDGPYGYRNNPFAEILVEEGNEAYTSRDGVLFTKDMRRLICYPCGKSDKEYHVPDGVEVIGAEAFLNVEHLERIYFPESVETVEAHAFTACRKLDFPEVVVIRRAEDGILVELTPAEQRPRETFYYWFNGESIQEADASTAIAILQPGTEIVESPREKRQIMDEFLEIADWIAYDREKNVLGEKLLEFGDRYYSEQG